MAETVLAAARETVLMLLVIAILSLLYRVEARWDAGPYYCTTMMRLNQRWTLAAFVAALLGTVAATLGTVMFAFERPALLRLFFDLTLVCWAVFFYLLNAVIRRGGVPRWPR